MKRLIVTIALVLVGAVGGGVIGFRAGIFIYPYWFLSDAANEELADNVKRTRLAVGEFIHVNPFDPVHWGKGRVSLYREGQDGAVVHLEDDSEVGPGPRFHVYLVDRESVQSGDDFLASLKVDLAHGCAPSKAARFIPSRPVSIRRGSTASSSGASSSTS
jgi:hypothetical protein